MDDSPDDDVDEVEDRLAPGEQARAWGLLHEVLARHGRVDTTPDGLVVHADPPLHVHLDAGTWGRLAGPDPAAGGPDDEPGGCASVLEHVDDAVTYRSTDQTHLVLFRGALHLSTRAQLPPLRSTTATGEWFAHAPDGPHR